MRKHSVLWWAFLVLGIVCSGILLFQRLSSEAKDTKACAAMSLEDLRLLEEESGISAEDWRGSLEAAGVCCFIGDEEGFVVPGEGVPATDLPLALVENHDRTSVLLPEGFDLDAYEGPLVKTLYLYEDYANRATEESAREIENLLFRAVTERGLRLLILTPFQTEDGRLILDPALYTDCLQGLGDRLEARGIQFGEGFSCMETQPLQPWLVMGAGLAPAMLGVWLLCSLLQRDWKNALGLAAAVMLLLLTVWNPALTQKLLMLAAAVVFPCVAAKGVADLPGKKPSRLWSLPLAASATVAMVLVVGWALLGGLSVSALMASRAYLMEYSIFSGVKAALLLPLVFGFCLLLWNLRKELNELALKRWMVILLGVVIFCGICGILLARSGDWGGTLSSVETALRNWLEDALYARPRTKELLFAAPCVPLFLWACRRDIVLLKLFFGMGVCLEGVSVVNTFCHAIAPISMSCARTLLAAGGGLVLGLVMAGILTGLFAWGSRDPWKTGQDG